MKKLKFNSAELADVKALCDILRSFPAFPMELSDKINNVTFKIFPILRTLNEKSMTFNEKKENLKAIKVAEDREVASKQIMKDIMAENKKLHEIEIEVLKVSDFKDGENNPIIISGQKETPNQNGGLIKQDYRDAFFDLKNFGIIE